MAERDPVAFISYVRSDDVHDSGRITELRQRLEGEVKMQTGRVFDIFQDRNDLKWGQQWKERIEDALFGVTFLIPIVTPSYFQSEACKKEFDTFLIRERALGENRLILPIYYVNCDEMGDIDAAPNEMASTLKARNWADWRELRFEPLSSPRLRAEIAVLATTIKSTMKELEAVFTASTAPPSVPAQESDLVSPPTAPVPPLPSLQTAEVPVVRKQRFSQQHLEHVAKNFYYAYTTNYDETIAPAKISEPADIMKLHSFLLAHVRSEVEAREDDIFAWAASMALLGKAGDLAMTFLIDNSGSMRGEKILNTACWTSIMSNYLTQANIPVEILGYTTRAWRGGQSREQWISDGKPEWPGRLNDLRHIVYKSFEETFQEADTNFGVMLREGLLKENIDGESLLWAHSRLREFSAKRKILFVISDGAPVDDSTLNENSPTFLHDHLIAVSSWIRAEADVELYGVGIGYDVSRYFGANSPVLGPDVGMELLKLINLAAADRWSEAGAFQWTKRPEKRAATTSRRKRRAKKEIEKEIGVGVETPLRHHGQDRRDD